MTANRQRAIRNALDQLGLHAAPKRVVEALKGFGIEVSEEFVVRVKQQMRRVESKAVAERSKRSPNTKSHSRSQQRKVPERRA